MQTPNKLERCTHLEPEGQPPKMQARAQYLSPELLSCRMHMGCAVVPVGTSVGQEPLSQWGAQTLPPAPSTSAWTSPLWQGGFS